MSGVNTPPNPPAPSIRDAAEALIAIADGPGWGAEGTAEAVVALREALAAPIASRPTILPDVDQALGAIGAMKRGEPIIPEDIHAIVALAEEGARQLEQFGLRFEADKRALDAWKAEHPQMVENAVLPDHADLVVWLVQLLDVVPDGPSVAEVDQVSARLRGAMLRAPNALTRDASVMIERLTIALRLTSRRAFMAEERARQLNAGWRPHLDFAGEPMEPGEDREPRAWPAADQIDQVTALELLRDSTQLFRYFEQRHGLADAAMTATRIERFLDPGDTDPALHRYDPDGGQTFSAAEHAEALEFRTHGADSAIDDEMPEIECKNTVGYDRRQMEERLNAELAIAIAAQPPGALNAEGIIADLITKHAPGWEYAFTPMAVPPRITLIRYAPEKPL